MAQHEEEEAVQYLKPRHIPKTKNSSAHKPRIVSRFKRDVLSYTGRLSDFDPVRSDKIRRVIDIVNQGTINAKNCDSFRAEALQFPGEVGYGAEKQFEGQGRMALRLSHFLSR